MNTPTLFALDAEGTWHRTRKLHAICGTRKLVLVFLLSVEPPQNICAKCERAHHTRRHVCRACRKHTAAQLRRCRVCRAWYCEHKQGGRWRCHACKE